MLNLHIQTGPMDILPSRRQIKKSASGADVSNTETTVLRTLSITDALEKYLKERKPFRPRTVKDYHDHMRYMQEWASDEGFSLMTMADFTEEMVQEYRSYLIEEFSGYTVNIRLRTLRAFLRWGYEKGYVPDLLKDLKLVKVVDDGVRNLSDDEVERLLTTVYQESYERFMHFVLIVVMLDTGIRISELLSVTWDMVKLGDSMISLPGRITKNKQPRNVPLSGTTTVPLLRELFRQNHDKFPESPYVFLSQNGTPFSTSRIRHLLIEYANEAGIQHLSPHMLRHTFARIYVRSGGNVFALQSILGHSTLDMSLRYVRLFSVEIVADHQKISPVNQFVA